MRCFQPLVIDGGTHLDATVDARGSSSRRWRYEQLGLPLLWNTITRGCSRKRSYDADDLDVVAQARHPGTQGAHAADDHLDGHPGLAGGIEPVDQVSVHQVVDLRVMPLGWPALALASSLSMRR